MSLSCSSLKVAKSQSDGYNRSGLIGGHLALSGLLTGKEYLVKSIGLRELKDHLSETIEEVEQGEVIEITKRGRTVARVVPVNRDVSIEERRAIVQDLDSLAAEMGHHTRVSDVAEAISNDRR
jgi:prevent-host-death family protein